MVQRTSVRGISKMGRSDAGREGDEPARRRHRQRRRAGRQESDADDRRARRRRERRRRRARGRATESGRALEATAAGNGDGPQYRATASRATSRYCCHAVGTTGAATRMKIVGPGRARLAARVHAGLDRRAVALAPVAGRAGGDDVLPDAGAAAAARDHVVDRQVGGRAAVLAGPGVAGEHGAARDPPPALVARHPHVGDQPDHDRVRAA